jgi:hypothetical protein
LSAASASAVFLGTANEPLGRRPGSGTSADGGSTPLGHPLLTYERRPIKQPRRAVFEGHGAVDQARVVEDEEVFVADESLTEEHDVVAPEVGEAFRTHALARSSLTLALCSW